MDAPRPPPAPAVLRWWTITRIRSKLYALALRDMGFQPVTVLTAADGFALACTTRPDAVVADVVTARPLGLGPDSPLTWGSPGRRTSASSSSPRIALPRVREQAAEAGCERFLLKPCLPDALISEIDAVLTVRGDLPQARPTKSGVTVSLEFQPSRTSRSR